MKRTLAVLLSMLMLFGCLPVTGFSVSDGAADGNAAAFMRIVHLDSGRKYFSAEEIKGVIDMAAENLYTHVELAFGNDGLRFLLDDMSVSINSTPYSNEAVTNAVKAGNAGYYDDPNGNALTESEMDGILAYAAEKRVGIIPLLNTPGHMDALLDAGEALTNQTLSYSGSKRTIDVTNQTATAFTLAVLEKYVRYFADNGCSYFNIGIDEYANDIYTSGSMGFGQLQSNGQYDDFIAYVNSAAAIVKEAGMTPMAFNDGIYFNNVTSSGTFDSDIAVCFWTAGWTGYTVASASKLAQQGHEIINTNDAWYYVLGNTTGYYNLSRAQTGTKETACTTVLTDSSGSVTPVGCMLCIWCDSPSVSYTTAEKANISGLLTNLAENNADYFKAPENSGDEVTLTDSATGIAVTADKLQTLTVSPVTPAPMMDGWLHSVAYDITLTDLSGAPYTGAAKVAIPVPDGWNPAYLRAYVQESDGSYSRIGGAYADGVYTASVPHFSVVVLAEIDPTASTTEQITLEIGGSKTVVDNSGNFEDASLAGLDTSIATVIVNGTTIEGGTEETIAKSIANGESYYIKSGDQYLSATATFGTLETATKWTVVSAGNNRYRLRNSNNQYLYYDSGKWSIQNQGTPLYYNDGQFYRNYVPLIGYWNSLGSAVTITETAAVNQTEITFTGVAAGTTSVTIGNTTYNITVAKRVETLSMYVGEETSFTDTSAAFETTNKDAVSVHLDGSKIRFTALAAGQATVTTASGTYTVTVIEPEGTAPKTITADHATTTTLHQQIDITSTELENGKFASTLALKDFTANSQTYTFWKARVIDRAQTQGGQLFDKYDNQSGTTAGKDNECMTYDGKAYDIDALKYNTETGNYYFHVVDTDDWKLLQWQGYSGVGSYPQSGHQLIFYYMIQYVKDDDNKASINTSDWGGDPLDGRYKITFALYEVTNDDYAGAKFLKDASEYFANGIQVITALHDPAYEVVRSVVDYTNLNYKDKTYPGQITDVPAVEAGRECTVRVYIRKKTFYSVKYDWINAPLSVTLPAGKTGITPPDNIYTVDTEYKPGATVNEGAYTYTFSGWYLDENFNKQAPATLTINGDVTLYGKWTKKLNTSITIKADSAEKVYDGKELSANGFTVIYQGSVITPNSDGKYFIAGEYLTITADVTGSRTAVGASDNTISNVKIIGNAGTEYFYTTESGTLTVYPKIVVEYYKDSIDASNKLHEGVIGYQTQTPSPEHGGDLLNVNDSVTLSGSWLTRYQPEGYQGGVQQGTVPYVVNGENEQTIRVLYLPAYTSLTIHKNGADDLDRNQTFLFRVTGEGVDVTVTVHGNSSVTIDGLTIGKQYTVTEITDWSWRYGEQVFTTTLNKYEAPATGGITVTLSANKEENSVTCTNTRTVPYWLDGDNYKVNIFGTLPNTPQS